MSAAAKESWIRWWKFNAVGAMGIVVQLVTLMLLKTGLRLNYLLATALAVEVTVIHNFSWHEHYTWMDRRSATKLARFLKFNLSTGACSIAGNVLAMKAFVEGLRVNYFLANLLSVAACSVLNFVVADRLVFLKHAPEPVRPD
jgi:putative flippase GtrA